MDESLSHIDRLRMAYAAVDVLTRQATLEPQVVRILLFGSVALGTDHSKSDIDLLVTYTGEPSYSNDEAFRSQVLKILDSQGIPAVEQRLSEKQKANQIAILILPEVIFQNPERYPDLVDSKFILSAELLKRTTTQLYPMGSASRIFRGLSSM